MANIPLKSIKFPGLPDRYVVKPDIADVTGLQTALDGKADKEDVYNGFVSENIQGSIASFDDGADDIPVKSLVAEIVPVQSGSGDPSPDNVRAISGWTECNVSVSGINIWDEVSESGYYDVADGTAKSGGTWKRSKNAIHCVPNTTYCFARSGSGSFGALLFYDANDNYIGYTSSLPDGLFTTPSNAYYIRFYTSTLQYDISINYPSTDTSYHAYNGSVHTISFASAGTVYGGSIDVTTGVLTVDRAMATFDGSENWVASSNADRYYLDLPVADFNYLWDNSVEASSNSYKYYGTLDSSTVLPDKQFALYMTTTAPNFREIMVHNTSVGNLAGFKTALSSTPMQVLYELATPQTYQLTPTEVKTLLGNNNVWADTGNIDLTYRADLGLYLDKIINA